MIKKNIYIGWFHWVKKKFTILFWNNDNESKAIEVYLKKEKKMKGIFKNQEAYALLIRRTYTW